MDIHHTLADFYLIIKGNMLIYVTGPLLGGLLAVPVYKLMNPEESVTVGSNQLS